MSMEYDKKSTETKITRLINRIVSVLFFAVCIAYGSDKNIGQSLDDFTEGIAQTFAIGLLTISNFFSRDEIETGYAVVSVETNETHNLTMPDNAVLAENIAKRGAHDDGFYLYDSFTNHLERTGLITTNTPWVHTDGTITLKARNLGLPLDGINFYESYSNVTVYAPRYGKYGFLPGSLWPNYTNSLIWTAVNENGSRVITWQNFLENRLPNYRSFQIEFKQGGEITYRYAPMLGNISTNSVGLYRNVHAQLITAPTNTTSITLSYIGDLSNGSGDTDGDGLSDYDEVKIHHTNPTLADSDGDSLDDSTEITNGTEPNNPDSDGDGIPDGFTEDEWLDHPLWGTPQNSNFAITFSGNIDSKTIFLLGDLPIPLLTYKNLTSSVTPFAISDDNNSTSPDTITVYFKLPLDKKKFQLYSKTKLDITVFNPGDSNTPVYIHDPQRVLKGETTSGNGYIANIDGYLSSNTDYSGCVHGLDDLELKLELTPNIFNDLKDYLTVNGGDFNAIGNIIPDDEYFFSTKDDPLTITVTLSSSALAYGELSCSIDLHNGYRNFKCVDCDKESKYESSINDTGNFIRLNKGSDTNSYNCIPVHINHHYLCECCSHGHYISHNDFILQSHSPEIKLYNSNGNLISTGDSIDSFVIVEPQNKTDTIDGASIIYKCNVDDPDKNDKVTHEYRYTIGDIRIYPDVNDDGVCDKEDIEELQSSGGTWVIKERDRYYKIALYSKAPGDVQLSADAGYYTECYKKSAGNSYEKITDLSAQIPHNGTFEFYIDSHSLSDYANDITFTMSDGNPDMPRTFIEETIDVSLARVKPNKEVIVQPRYMGSSEDIRGYSTEKDSALDWKVITPHDNSLLLFNSTHPPSTEIDNARFITVTNSRDFIKGQIKVTHKQYSDVFKTIYAESVALMGDYDRDGKIGSSDIESYIRRKPIRFWINNDKDNGDIANGLSDLPGNGSKNANDGMVNGRGDLLDFTPIWLALSDNPDLRYKLSQADNAVKVVYTSLSKNEAGKYLHEDIDKCGYDLDEMAYEASSMLIPRNGTWLPDVFVELVRNNSQKGVILLEGRSATTKPLVLEVYYDEECIRKAELPLSISTVEDMYRFHNIRFTQSIPCYSREPDNLPDSETDNVDFFFAHGFLVREQDSFAWGAELFKRLWQEGSRARFHMVTWSSDEASDGGASPNISYEHNVNNAFLSASNYASLLQGIKNANNSRIVLSAHSLGNMLTSAAIQDHNAPVDVYFALNGAVPSEAYDESEANTEQSADNFMLHPYWRDYKMETWASNYHMLFNDDSNDDRRKVTWKGRFKDVTPYIYNYMSSGDEVLEIMDTSDRDLNLASGIEIDWSWYIVGSDISARRYTWQKQALFKGRSSIYGTMWAGWGFNKEIDGSITYAHIANTLSDETLKVNPVFNHQPSYFFRTNIVQSLRDNLLARGIPELSHPIGYEYLGNSADNKDMNVNFFRKDERWPNRTFTFDDSGVRRKRWLHSDLINVAHFFTFKLYQSIIEKGKLK